VKKGQLRSEELFKLKSMQAFHKHKPNLLIGLVGFGLNLSFSNFLLNLYVNFLILQEMLKSSLMMTSFGIGSFFQHWRFCLTFQRSAPEQP